MLWTAAMFDGPVLSALFACLISICACAVGVPSDAACHIQANIFAVQPAPGPSVAVSCLWRLQGCAAEADQLQADHQPLSQAATSQI